MPFSTLSFHTIPPVDNYTFWRRTMIVLMRKLAEALQVSVEELRDTQTTAEAEPTLNTGGSCG
jgi:hypothetical protein